MTTTIRPRPPVEEPIASDWQHIAAQYEGAPCDAWVYYVLRDGVVRWTIRTADGRTFSDGGNFMGPLAFDRATQSLLNSLDCDVPCEDDLADVHEIEDLRREADVVRGEGTMTSEKKATTAAYQVQQFDGGWTSEGLSPEGSGATIFETEAAAHAAVQSLAALGGEWADTKYRVREIRRREMTTAITPDQIEDLRREAIEHYDDRMRAYCDVALGNAAAAHTIGICRCDVVACVAGHVGAEQGHCECGDLSADDARARVVEAINDARAQAD
jgi:hypothetical protein